jgi:hypothetical protein
VLNVIYEWRMYDTHPGKLSALLERFRKGEMKLFEKHGMKIVGFWTNLIGGESGVLYYMVGYKDLADREKCWQGFRTDPEWHKMREESRREGPLVSKVRNMLLKPTDFSPF